MAMRVHHLNCGSLCPAFSSFMGPRGFMLCHCLLIETEDGLVLVDTGFGQADLAEPIKRLGWGFKTMTRPKLDPAETAWAQVQKLGFSVDDVRHIFLTHLDLDHAGGLSDFPRAKVHIHAPELDAAAARTHFLERERYKPLQWAHGPEWVRHEVHGESWKGFDCVSAVEGLPDLLIVPLAGHTRGHAGIAVHTDGGWLLHCGDAYFSHFEMDVEKPSCPVGLRIFQSVMQMNGKERHHNQARLRELARDHGDVRLFCAHDPDELDGFNRPAGL